MKEKRKMKRILKLLMIVSLIIPLSYVNQVNALEESETIIKNDETGIPDKGLYEWGLKTYDSNGDGILTKKEIEEVNNKEHLLLDKFYDMRNSNICSLKGIHFFDSGHIYFLDIRDNKGLKSLDGIEKLETIEGGIDLRNCSLETIEGIQKFTELKGLMVENNNLTDIPDLTALKKLDDYGCPHAYKGSSITDYGWVCFYGNKLSNLDLLNNLPQQVLSVNKWVETEAYYIVNKDTKMVDLSEFNNENLDFKYIDFLLRQSDTDGVYFNQVSIVPSDIINSIHKNQKNALFNINDKETGKLIYSWEFNKKNFDKNFDKDISLKIDFESKNKVDIEKITKQQNIFCMQFAYHGDLPSSPTIKVDVSKQYKDGENIYLYYYNDEKGTIELKSKDVKVSDGYAEFVIDHCSTYFFTSKEIKNDNENIIVDQDKDKNENLAVDTDKNNNENIPSKEVPKTGDNSNIVLFSIATVCSLTIVVGLTLLKEKRK